VSPCILYALNVEKGERVALKNAQTNKRPLSIKIKQKRQKDVFSTARAIASDIAKHEYHACILRTKFNVQNQCIRVYSAVHTHFLACLSVCSRIKCRVSFNYLNSTQFMYKAS